jgi:hypothetical protein
MIIGADQIDVFDDGISKAPPSDIQGLVAGGVGGVADGGVVAIRSALTDAGRVIELGLRIAGKRILDPFLAPLPPARFHIRNT